MLLGPETLIANIQPLKRPGHALTPRLVLGRIPKWPTAHKQALAITPADMKAFQSTGQLHTMILDLDQQPATLLHSLGSILEACPCGCRAAISEERLRY